MGIFDAGTSLMNAAYQYAGYSICYRRGKDTLAANIPAKLGKTVFRYIDASGYLTRTEQRDFLVRSSDLPTEPETGDEIIFDEEIYIVSAPNDEPCWKWHSRCNRSEKRIHAKRAGEA